MSGPEFVIILLVFNNPITQAMAVNCNDGEKRDILGKVATVDRNYILSRTSHDPKVNCKMIRIPIFRKTHQNGRSINSKNIHFLCRKVHFHIIKGYIADAELCDRIHTKTTRRKCLRNYQFNVISVARKNCQRIVLKTKHDIDIDYDLNDYF